ncbi:hypothetical protein [Nocardia sp. NPDC050793]|uniref:hypothetical protein n=1 Tax=Nocardia sp. NPDC050793 TaxID=3155159 RepID=UPI0033D43BF1
MGWDEEAMTPEDIEFIRARSKAFGDFFMEFALDRGLDLDVETWSTADRDQYAVRSNVLIEEWRRKHHRS